MNDRYEYTDKVLETLYREFVRKFEPMRSILKIDEVSVLKRVGVLYDELLELVIRAFLEIALIAYNSEAKKKKKAIEEEWLLDFLLEYDPVTKYVFLSEVERKRARFAESLIASDNKSAEVDTALRLWSKMIAQYAIEVTDKAVEQAFLDNDISRVRWVTEKDERRCSVCASREGKIYGIKNIPPKPHIGCRCTTVPV